MQAHAPLPLFLELDRATVPCEGERGWARKVAAYLVYHNSGQFQPESFRVIQASAPGLAPCATRAVLHSGQASAIAARSRQT